jgi:hypothetical protein
MPEPQKLKRCNSCGKEFPATPLYFHAEKQSKDGLRGKCRECRNREMRRRK